MEELDRILTSEDPLAPSSGFAARVMEAVRADDPPLPMPFPWGPFVLGMAASLFGVASGVWLLSSLDLSPVGSVLVASWPEAGCAASVIFATLAMLHAPRLRTAAGRLARILSSARVTPRA